MNLIFKRRTAYALANALRPKREGTLFEHFIVVGLPNTAECTGVKPKEPKRFKPQVLYQYPKQSKYNMQLESLTVTVGFQSNISNIFVFLKE